LLSLYSFPSMTAGVARLAVPRVEGAPTWNESAAYASVAMVERDSPSAELADVLGRQCADQDISVIRENPAVSKVSKYLLTRQLEVVVESK